MSMGVAQPAGTRPRPTGHRSQFQPNVQEQVNALLLPALVHFFATHPLTLAQTCTLKCSEAAARAGATPSPQEDLVIFSGAAPSLHTHTLSLTLFTQWWSMYCFRSGARFRVVLLCRA